MPIKVRLISSYMCTETSFKNTCALTITASSHYVLEHRPERRHSLFHRRSRTAELSYAMHEWRLAQTEGLSWHRCLAAGSATPLSLFAAVRQGPLSNISTSYWPWAAQSLQELVLSHISSANTVHMRSFF